MTIPLDIRIFNIVYESGKYLLPALLFSAPDRQDDSEDTAHHADDGGQRILFFPAQAAEHC